MNKNGNPVTLVTHSRDNQPVADAMLARQDSFLDAYRKYGTQRKGCQVAGIHRDTVRRWVNENTLGFRQRFTDAHDDYVDSIEELLDTMNKGLKPGQTPIGILAQLNAERPDKWSRNVQVTHEVGREVMSTLKAIQDQQGKPEAVTEARKPWQLVEGQGKPS